MTETFYLAIGFFYVASCVCYTTISLAILLFRKTCEWLQDNTIIIHSNKKEESK